MRRRLLTGFVLLDGLCALLAPALLPHLAAEAAPPAAYVEIAGTCVEDVQADDQSLGGRVVPASFCD